MNIAPDAIGGNERDATNFSPPLTSHGSKRQAFAQGGVRGGFGSI